ncbi:hypothetical protein BD560DRAFT_198068 [Blakeslea trispora]|nr:hypothetical protein BD560DRAFT_198068 [Blakeslea trispora]
MTDEGRFKVGYQCMGYYRALVASGELKDETYVLENGKLKLVDKTKMRGSKSQPKEELGPQWETEQVKQLEEKVDGLLKEIHGASLQTAATKPKPKPKAKPAAIKQTGQIGKLMRQMIANPNSPIHRLEAEPEVAHLKHKDWEKEWHDRLEDYRQFLKPYLDKDVKMAHWHTKQAWRRGLTTTEMLLRKDMAIKPPLTEVNQLTETPKVQQTSLSRFFTGVKKRKIDTPDDLVSYTRIPNDLYSGVKQIKPLNKRTQADASKTIYVELDQIENMTTLLDNICQRGEKESSTQSSLECILADPPWEFYVEDGKNDGRCSLNLEQFRSVMEKTVRHMSAGMIFVWTHKLIQADVVRTMYDMDCKYVENLVWFKKSVNNVHLDDPSPFFSSTKEILLMFKKGDGFEMRHQRSPDVIIDFEKPRHEWIDDEFTEPKPVAVYEMIETLLPKAGYDESIHRGRCLELWAKKKSPRREGWIAFHVNKTM